ncbi:hypothetical protein Mpet_0878 [Methanolacinia petrolearia DSM 11571]|uniref:Uncharacterized protein n=2 Tax=Methanolacinia TaxID=230355 RepID=E1RJC9_METP4|nr:hypothetical protein Mpet_0878 [Methanolacinia petrolearia DSM 11571]
MKMKKTMRALGLLMIVALAGTMFVSVVSAESTEFAKDFVTPSLDLESSVQLKEVNLPLSPISDESVLSISPGSIIYHTDDGLTKVFDQEGKALFYANDKDSAMIPTSAGVIKPATFIHLVPTESHSYHKGNQTFVTDEKGNLILTIINEKAIERSGTEIQSNSRSNEWIEWAEDASISSLTQFDAYWYVPDHPPSSESLEVIYLFNGISPYGGGPGIVQPVLEWNRPDTGTYWTAAAWGATPLGEDDIGSRIQVSEGDLLKGRLYWSDTYDQWYVQLSDLTTGTSSTVWTNVVSGHTNLEAYVTLEGYYFDDNTDVPGDTEFYNMVFKNGGSTVTMSFSEYYGSMAQQLLSGLDVNIISGTDVELKTAN